MIDERVKELYNGNPIKCTEKEYRDFLRSQIQNFAGKMVDEGQDVRAMIALSEVKSLDKKFGL